MGTSFGTCGIVYSVVLEVCQFYYLHRSITLTTWTQVQEELKTQAPSPENPNGYPDMLLKHRHVEFLWDPYERDGEHAVAQMTWDIIPQPTSCDGNIASAGVECVPEFIGELLDRIEECQFLYTITAIIFNLFPSATPWLVSMALKAQIGERRGTYYNMLLLHTAENAGFASELVFPVQQNTQKDAKIPSPFNCWPLPRNAGLWTLENVQSGIKNHCRGCEASGEHRWAVCDLPDGYPFCETLQQLPVHDVWL